MATIRSPGLGSNLDVNGIIDQLMAIERAPITQLDRKEAGYQVQISAVAALKGALTSFQSAVSRLDDLSRYQATKTSIGDATVVAASITGTPVEGTTSVEVQNLAVAQKLSSGGFSSTSAVVGTGTLTIDFGSYDAGGNTFTPNTERGTQTITIDSAHNTLAGIRDAINDADVGVTASIVNDGGEDGYHLVIASRSTGLENGLRITVDDGDGTDTDTSGLSQLAYDPTLAAGSGENLSEAVAAEDALVLIDGITVTSASNTIEDAIEGMRLSLLSTNVGEATNLTITRDSGGAKSAVAELVASYNELVKTMKQLTSFDGSTGAAGPLNGDALPRSVESEIKRALTGAIENIGGTYSRLAEVGVTLQRDGSLKVDDAKLSSALERDAGNVAALFAVRGTTSDSLVEFLTSSDKSKAGLYNVVVTQHATQGSATGAAAAGLTITEGVDDRLTLEVDGVSTSVTIAAGTYGSASALATAIELAINGAEELEAEGISVDVTESAGVLSITSNRYGSASSVAIEGGTARAGLFGGSETETVGLDVAGSIGGVAAVGSGRKLVGARGSTTDGIELEIAGGALGARGTLRFSRGLADRLDSLIDALTATTGVFSARTEGIEASIEKIDERRAELGRRLELVEANYRARFAALDRIVSRMTSTSNFLSQQLANLPKTSRE